MLGAMPRGDRHVGPPRFVSRHQPMGSRRHLATVFIAGSFAAACAGNPPAASPQTTIVPSATSSEPLSFGSLSARPQDADDKNPDQVDSADVVIRILVSASGSAERVEILHDPDGEFGDAAKRLAIAHHYQPALDRAGVPTEGWMTIKLHFRRDASP